MGVCCSRKLRSELIYISIICTFVYNIIHAKLQFFALLPDLPIFFPPFLKGIIKCRSKNYACRISRGWIYATYYHRESWRGFILILCASWLVWFDFNFLSCEWHFCFDSFLYSTAVSSSTYQRYIYYIYTPCVSIWIWIFLEKYYFNLMIHQ